MEHDIQIKLNNDLILLSNSAFSKDRPYRINPTIIYKDKVIKQLINILIITDKEKDSRKTDYLEIRTCTCEQFLECKLKRKCKNNWLFAKTCPYSEKEKIKLKRQKSKDHLFAEDFIKIAKFLTNDELYEYATWIIQNISESVSKGLFEIMKNIPELDPNNFSTIYIKNRSLKEIEIAIKNQEKFLLYELKPEMPPFVKSYLQMTNDYLTELNNFISGVTLGIEEESYINLRLSLKDKRLFVPIFNYFIINIDSYLFSGKDYNYLRKNYECRNSRFIIPKNEFETFIKYISSNEDNIHRILLERYELGEHKRELSKEEIDKLYF